MRTTFQGNFLAAMTIAVWMMAAGNAPCAPESVAQKQKDFFQVLHSHFAEWDTNHDGELSAEEIDALVNDPKITGTAAAVVTVLKEVTRNEKFHMPPLTGDALGKYAAAPPSSPDAPNFGKMYASALGQIAKANHELFSSGVPTLDTFHQGRLGDCYFLAPMGAAVNRDGKQIQKLIETLPDGSYDVHFANGRTLHVPRLTDAEIALTTASNHKGGLWLNVIEDAYGTVRNEHTPEGKQVADSIDIVGRAGSPSGVMKLLTGNNIRTFQIRQKGQKDQPPGDAQVEELLPKLRKAIETAVDERRLICCGTPKQTSVPAITPGHVYAVLNFDKANGEVEVWNPHGNHFKPKGTPGLENGYPTQGGRFTVPLPQFAKIFGSVTYEVSQADSQNKSQPGQTE